VHILGMSNIVCNEKTEKPEEEKVETLVISIKDDYKARITINCLELLQTGGISTAFAGRIKESTNSFKSRKIDMIPIAVEVWELDPSASVSGPAVIFTTPDKCKLFLYDVITESWEMKAFRNERTFHGLGRCDTPHSADGLFLSASDVILMKSLAVRVYYTLKNVWQRLGYNLLSINTQFGFTDAAKGSRIAIAGIVDSDFWEMETLQKKIVLARRDDGVVFLMPERMPELESIREVKLNQIIAALKKGDRREIIVEKNGKQEMITVKQNSDGWFLVFVKNLELIKDKDDLLRSEVGNLACGKKITIPIKEKISGGSVLAQKNKDGVVILFIGDIPEFTDEQDELLYKMLVNFNEEKWNTMIVGSDYVEGEAKKIFLEKNEKGQTLILQEGMPKLTKPQYEKLLRVIADVPAGGYKIMSIPQKPRKLTNLAKILQLTEHFLPKSPSKK